MVTVCALVLVSLLVASAEAQTSEAPPNDNRASAQVIAAFPATMEGTTVEATVERLDPQRSQCGTVESTAWYRVDKAPDGTIFLSVQGTGLAPVVRVYNVTKSGIAELDCSSAKVSQAANVTWETTRGNSYLILVGKKTGAADGAFQLSAQLFLPPVNDSSRQATKLAVRDQIKGTTLGATSDESDPHGCSLAGGTVWYSINPGRASRMVVRLHAAGDLDAAAVLLRKFRSQTESIGCIQTDRKGDALLAWDVEKGAVYLMAVGQRKGSSPGDFSLGVLAAQPREVAPGQRLRRGGVRSRVDWLTDVTDVWWTRFAPGTTYRIAFSSSGCAALTVRGKVGTLRSFDCSGYTTFTPGPHGGGRYIFEVTAPGRAGSVSYKLKVLRAGVDDVGVGLGLANLTTARGTLGPTAGDVVDLYHFDVPRLSAVRLHLESAQLECSITLLTYDGGRMGSSSREIGRTLGRGHYVVAVRASFGASSGRYRLSLVVREVTKTTLAASSAQIPPRSSVVFTIAVTPQPDGGRTAIQIDRFDSLAGWQFNRIIPLGRSSGPMSWKPPTLGRWRARATFLGTVRFSPSRSGYATVLVAQPLGGGRIFQPTRISR